MTVEVFKIQRCVYAFEGEPSDAPMLVYNKDHSIEFQCPHDKDTLELFENNEYKIYVEAEYQGMESLCILRRVEPPMDW